MDCNTAQQKIIPYIERKLGDREMEEFVEHIRGCKTCSEELEVYFTIYYALEHLDRDEQDSYDIRELLEQDLKRAEKKVQNRHIMKFYRSLLFALFAVLACFFAFTAAQTIFYGSFERTAFYSLFWNESADTEKPQDTEDAKEKTEPEETEAETNRKKQIIVKTPETEAWSAPKTEL